MGQQFKAVKNLESKENTYPKIFGSKTTLGQKILALKNVESKKTLCKKAFGHKKNVGLTIFLVQKNLLSKNILDPINFWLRKILNPKNLGDQKMS